MGTKEDKSITYHNKDVLSKIFAENLKEKSFQIYGLSLPKIKEILPTNLPEVQANELRIDNLFLLEDDSICIVDYESCYKTENKLKYMQYIIRVLERYKKIGFPKKVRMIVIYTADVEEADAVFSVGCLSLEIEQAFLSKLDSYEIKGRLTQKIQNKSDLTEEELMEFIILPLTYKGSSEKQNAVKEAIALAIQIQDRSTQNFILSGLLVFTDKIISEELSNRIKEMIRMTKVAALLLEEGIEKGIEKGIERGIERGKNANKIEMIKTMYQNNMDSKQIAKVTNLPLAEVENILAD